MLAGPVGLLGFASNGCGARVGSQQGDCEPSQGGEVFGCLGVPGVDAVLVERQAGQPVLVVLGWLFSMDRWARTRRSASAGLSVRESVTRRVLRCSAVPSTRRPSMRAPEAAMSTHVPAPHSRAANAISKTSDRSCRALDARGSGTTSNNARNPRIASPPAHAREPQRGNAAKQSQGYAPSATALPGEGGRKPPNAACRTALHPVAAPPSHLPCSPARRAPPPRAR